MLISDIQCLWHFMEVFSCNEISEKQFKWLFKSLMIINESDIKIQIYLDDKNKALNNRYRQK